MAKAKRPYEDLSDKELVNTWRKRDDEYTDFYMVPRLEGKVVDDKRAADLAVKIDRIEDELKLRDLNFNRRFYELTDPLPEHLKGVLDEISRH